MYSAKEVHDIFAQSLGMNFGSSPARPLRYSTKEIDRIKNLNLVLSLQLCLVGHRSRGRCGRMALLVAGELGYRKYHTTGQLPCDFDTNLGIRMAWEPSAMVNAVGL